MYRHFATITIVITACIALFADGERREAIGAEIRADQQRQAMRAADAQRNGPTKIGAERKVYSGSGFGEENSGSGGDTSINPDQSEPGANPTQFRPTRHEVATMPPGYFDPATGLPKAGQIGRLPPKTEKKTTPYDLERLKNAGEARAGAATQADS